MRSILKRLLGRHTTAVAYLALFAALGGSAYAAATVTGTNIKDGTITGRDVKNRSLGTNKLSASALGSLAGQPGPAGPRGPSGISGWEMRTSPGTRLGAWKVGVASVDCASNQRALGGGVSSTSQRTYVSESAPKNSGTGWAVRAHNYSSDTPASIYAWVICAKVSS